jgi:hypothetical protein
MEALKLDGSTPLLCAAFRLPMMGQYLLRRCRFAEIPFDSSWGSDPLKMSMVITSAFSVSLDGFDAGLHQDLRIRPAFEVWNCTSGFPARGFQKDARCCLVMESKPVQTTAGEQATHVILQRC